uniref:Uncharacterized protein n=1 Tax=Stegastes partitus TaxID=144197 RepID=A0A3B5BC18_9TELE
MDPAPEQRDQPAGVILPAVNEEQLPYPDVAPVVCFCLTQSTRPRSWCLKIVHSPYPFLLQIYLLGTQTAFKIDYIDYHITLYKEVHIEGALSF